MAQNSLSILKGTWQVWIKMFQLKLKPAHSSSVGKRTIIEQPCSLVAYSFIRIIWKIASSHYKMLFFHAYAIIVLIRVSKQDEIVKRTLITEMDDTKMQKIHIWKAV